MSSVCDQPGHRALHRRNNDAADFLKQHHDRITDIHIKDWKRNEGPNVELGTGDTPIKERLRSIRDNHWAIYGIIERE